MGHYSSKPCDIQQCCGKGEFVSTGCMLGYRVFVDAFVRIVRVSTGLPVSVEYFHTGSDAVYIPQPPIVTAAEYRLQIKLYASGQWITLDTIDWTPTNEPGTFCCIETAGLAWYEMDELILSLDKTMSWVGQCLPGLDFDNSPCCRYPGYPVPGLLGTYYLPYAYTDSSGTRFYSHFTSQTLSFPAVCYLAARTDPYESSVSVAVTEDGKVGVSFGGYVPEPFVPYYFAQSMYSDCTHPFYAGAFIHQLSPFNNTGVLPIRQFTIMNRTYLAPDLPLWYPNISPYVVPWQYLGANA